MTRLRRSDRGAIAIEFVVLFPLLGLLLAVVVAGARLWWVRTSVAQLAASAARQASIARSVPDAQASAAALVRSDARQTGIVCVEGSPVLTLDLSGFGRPVGTPATVTARVRCTVPLSDVLLPIPGGSIVVESVATSTLDRFRTRG